MKNHLKTQKSKEKYLTTKGRFITCKLCNHEFKHRTKEEKKKWTETKYTCPKCHARYVNKPDTERILMELQDTFYDSGRKEIYINQIQKISTTYTESLLKKYFSNYLSSPDDLVYYRSKAVSFLIEEFYVDKEYRVWGSWKGLIDKKIRQAIFEQNEKSIETLIKERNKDDLTLINTSWSFEDGHNANIEDPTQSKMFESIESSYSKQLLHDCLISCTYEFSKIYTNHQMYMSVFNMCLLYKTNEERVDRFFQLWPKEGKDAFLKLKELYKQEIVKSIS